MEIHVIVNEMVDLHIENEKLGSWPGNFTNS